MPEFDARQVVVTHPAIWDGLVKWGDARNLELVRIPAGLNEDGELTMDPGDDLPPYAFMPKGL